MNVVKDHLGWLTDFRAYRDEVIHRLVIKAPVTGWEISQRGKDIKGHLAGRDTTDHPETCHGYPAIQNDG